MGKLFLRRVRRRILGKSIAVDTNSSFQTFLNSQFLEVCVGLPHSEHMYLRFLIFDLKPVSYHYFKSLEEFFGGLPLGGLRYLYQERWSRLFSKRTEIRSSRSHHTHYRRIERNLSVKCFYWRHSWLFRK